MIYQMATVLRFGMHRGKTVQEILDTDPRYIDWALKNVGSFQMSEEDKESVADRVFKHQQEAEEYMADFYGIDIYY